jgi:hypothetical protein
MTDLLSTLIQEQIQDHFGGSHIVATYVQGAVILVVND